jgi:hypothetical protein
MYCTTMKTPRPKKLRQTQLQAMTHPLPPLRSDLAALDRRENFASMSTIKPPAPEVQRAFIAGKFKLLRTHPTIHLADRKTAMENFKAIVQADLPTDAIGPVPGGVGYGVFYNAGFKNNFATGTAISWEIVCPTLPGGNVNTWLYLTSTNRSAKGVEAFIAYEGQQEFTFNIFDWALPEQNRWQPAVPFASLASYLGMETTHGAECQVIAVINSTYQQTPGMWANEVRLLSVQDQQWHLVYQNLYAATLQDQTIGFVGSWAPIVETFQDVYSGTKPMGALKAQILSRDGTGAWGQWTPLSSTQSDLRTDNKGFSLLFMDQNYSWAVQS